MLDIQYIREHADVVKQAALDKNLTVDVDRLLAVDAERISLLQEIEALNAAKNQLNQEIQKASTPEERQKSIEKGKGIKAELEAKEPRFTELKQEFDTLMVQMPTVAAPEAPRGNSEDQNVEIMQRGTKREFTFAPKTHLELGARLDILDLERGAKVAGYRGYYLKNEGVLLVMGLMQYAIQKMVTKGYTVMIPPTLVKGFALKGSGYFKGVDYDDAVDEVYQVTSAEKESDGEASKDKKFLVGTAEPSLLAYYADEVLDQSQLPLKLCGYSQCYRSEIGSYGKDTKGMYRVHEFMKVEQVVLAANDIDQSNTLQQEMCAISREMHEELGLPYRVLDICTGDMSAGKYRAFDIEDWMPGMNRYGETGSASNFLDWQSRRLNVKYRDATTGERKHVFMLNNTALPSPRVFIAILENYQQEDGSVMVPEVLRPYVGKDVIVPRS